MNANEKKTGKTLSRKARSRPESHRGSAMHSPTFSPAGSHPGSKVNSRYATDDENASDSDSEMNDSIGSVLPEETEAGADWQDRLGLYISELLDRKRSSGAGREATLKAYLFLTKHHYACDQIESSFNQIIGALMKSVRSGSREEQTLALKALTLTVFSSQSEIVFDQLFSPLKSVCQDSEEEVVKIEAINAMIIALLYGGGSESAAEEMLEFLIEIVESDGHSIEAGDNAPVVTAALQAWGFVASHMDDLRDYADQAMEAFIDQLDSADVEVQTAAGSDIALVFEAQREFEGAQSEDEETGAVPEPFNLYYDPKRLAQQMSSLTRESSKSLSKKDRRNLKTSFTSIVTSLERGKGPGYSTAGRAGANPHTAKGGAENEDGDFKEFGYREKIRIQGLQLIIDTWALSARVETLKEVLGGGFAAHYMENPSVKDCLSDAQVNFLSSPSKKSKKSHLDVALGRKR